MILSLKQTKAIDYLEDNITNELLFGGGAGGGKSFLGCYWQLKNRLKYPGTRGLIGRAKLKTLKETTLNSFWEVCKLQGVKANTHFKFNSQSGIITFFNGSEILLKDLYLYPSDPEFDELGSLEITDFFIDEANQITKKAKQIVQSRVRYKLREFNLIPKGLMTCNPALNWVYTDYYKPFTNGVLKENKQFIQSLVTDNKDIDPSYIKNLDQLDIASRERLRHGNWDYDNDPTSLIPFNIIDNIFHNDHVIDGRKYLTCDVARFGSDKAIILVWSGFKIIEKYVFQISKTTDIQNCINTLRTKYNIPASDCIADEDGVGGGVVDSCKIKGFVNNSKPMNKQYANLKTECGYKLAKIANENKIYFESDIESIEKDHIIQELGQLKTFDVDKDNKLRLLPKAKIKENIGRSPDWLDNFIMRMYFENRPDFVAL